MKVMKLHLGKDDLVEIHSEMIERFGGIEGTLDQRTLNFAVDRASSTVDSREEAAMLLTIIAQEHPFMDANKRTGFAAADVLLRLNGLHLSVGDQEALEFVALVARGDAGYKEVVKWLGRRVRRRSPSIR